MISIAAVLSLLFAAHIQGSFQLLYVKRVLPNNGTARDGSKTTFEPKHAATITTTNEVAHDFANPAPQAKSPTKQ